MPLKPSQYRLWADITKSTLRIHKVFDIVSGTSIDPTPAGINSDDPLSPEYLALPANQRRTIEEWKYRHDLAREAIIKALKPEDHIKVCTMTYVQQIWTRLYQEYGQIYDVKRAMAECDLHALIKSSTQTMQEHINKFEHLIAEVNFQLVYMCRVQV